MSLSNILMIARSALIAQQRALNVTARNIANAQTPGYSRQRLGLSAGSPIGSAGGWLQGGVMTEGVSRVRDSFLDASYRRESSLLGGSATLRRVLEGLELGISEPSETGIAAGLDNLFNAFADLANDPTSKVNRDLVRTAASRFIERVRVLDSQLEEAKQDALARMRGEVGEVNALAERIAHLNEEIRNAGGREQAPPELLDQRDLLVDRMSEYVSVRVLERDDGSIGVMAGESLLVDGTTSRALTVRPVDGGGYGFFIGSGEDSIDLQGGSLRALERLIVEEIPRYEEQLDAFAKAVVIEVNAIHRNGYTLDGRTGIDFFNADRTTAGTIALSDEVASSSTAIVAGSTAEAGDNTIALELSGLAHRSLDSLEGRTLRSLYTDFALLVGSEVRDAIQDEATHQTLASHADAMRLSVSGVSVDEEMVNLITQQEAYAAAARLLTVADQMIQEVLRLI